MPFNPQQLDTVATQSTTRLGLAKYDAEQQDYNVTDMLSSAWKQGTLYDEFSQMMDEREQQFQSDDSWTIDDTMKGEIIKNYSQQEGKYLQESQSQSEWDWRRQQIELDRADAIEAQKYGTTGAVFTLAASIADPAGWAIGALTGGAAKAAQVGRAASGALGMALGGASGYAYGKFEQQHNTSVTDTDVILGAAFGAVLEGGIAAAVAGPRKAKMINDTNSAIDETINGKIDIESKTLRDRGLDEVKVNEAIDARTRELQSKVDTDMELATAQSKQISDDVVYAKAVDPIISSIKQPTAQLKKAVNSFVKRVEQTATKFDAQVKTAEARVAKATTKAEVGKASAALRKIKDNRNKALREQEMKFSDKYKFKPSSQEVLDNIQGERLKSNEAKSQLSKAEANQAARDELEAWNAKSLDERLDELFPDSKPLRDSVGAMRSRYEDIYNVGNEGGLSTDITDTLPTDLNKSSTAPKVIFDAVKGNKLLSNTLISPFTYLSTSAHDGIQALGYLLLESGQGARKGGTVSKQSASSIVNNVGRIMRTAGGGAYTRNKAYEAFSKAKGKGRLKAHFDLKGRKEFDSQIQLAVDSRAYKESLPDYMQEAVNSVEAQMSKALELVQQAGVRGFENIKDTKHYLPKLLNTANIKNAARTHGKSTVIAVISKAYQNGGLKISKSSADKLAIVRYNQMMRLHPDTGGVPRDLNTNDLVEELRKQGIDDETIESIVARRDLEEMNEDISNRAKKSLLPDLHSEVGGLKFGDLVDNDLESLIEGYIRETAGSIAVKRTIGASTINEAKGIIDVEVALAKGAGNMSDSEFRRLELEETMLRDVVDVLYGKDLNGDGWRSTIKGASRLRTFTGIIRLYMSGLASIPELGRVVASNGLTVAAKNIRSFNRDAIGNLKQADLKELDEIIPFAGEDWAFEPRTMRMEDFAEMGATQEKFWGMLDVGLAGAQRVSQILSLQRSVQGFGEKLAYRSIAHRVKNGGITEQQARDAGWVQESWTRKGDESVKGETNFLDEVKAFMEANPSTTIEGKKMFNAAKMSPEMLDRLRTGIHRLAMRDMQRMTVGELPLGFNNWIGATMLQFKSFLIGSIGKQLVHDIRAGDKAKSAAAFTMGLGLASAVVGIKGALQWAGDPSEKGSLSKYLGDRMTGIGGTYNALMATGQLSSLGLVADALATFNLLPDDLQASQKNQWQGARRGFAPPVMGLATDIDKFAHGDGEAKMQALQNVVPFVKTIGVNQVLTNLYKED